MAGSDLASGFATGFNIGLQRKKFAADTIETKRKREASGRKEKRDIAASDRDAAKFKSSQDQLELKNVFAIGSEALRELNNTPEDEQGPIKDAILSGIQSSPAAMKFLGLDSDRRIVGMTKVGKGDAWTFLVENDLTGTAGPMGPNGTTDRVQVISPRMLEKAAGLTSPSASAPFQTDQGLMSRDVTGTVNPVLGQNGKPLTRTPASARTKPGAIPENQKQSRRLAASAFGTSLGGLDFSFEGENADAAAAVASRTDEIYSGQGDKNVNSAHQQAMDEYRSNTEAFLKNAFPLTRGQDDQTPDAPPEQPGFFDRAKSAIGNAFSSGGGEKKRLTFGGQDLAEGSIVTHKRTGQKLIVRGGELVPLDRPVGGPQDPSVRDIPRGGSSLGIMR